MNENVGINFVGNAASAVAAATQVNAALNGITSNAQRANAALGNVGSGGLGRYTGFDDLVAKADRLKTGFAEVEQGYNGLETASGGLSLAMVGVAAAAGGAAIGIAKMAYDLGTAGEAVVQTEKKFTAFAGGPKQAADALAAMRTATEGGLSAMDAMTYSSMLLSMGLAKNGDEAAKITRIASMLGPAYRDAATNIADFSMLLANQSTRRLDQFGLSVDAVKRKQAELVASGMDSQLAFTNAVLEIGSQKMDQLAEAGVHATTAAQQLTAAWTDLRNTVGKELAPAAGGIQGALAGGLRIFTGALQEGAAGNSEQRLAALRAELKLYTDMRKAAEALPDSLGRSVKISFSQSQIDGLTTQLAEVDDKVRRSLAEGWTLPEMQGGAGTYAPITTSVADAIAQGADSGIAAMQAAFSSAEFRLNFSANMPQAPDAWGNGADWQRYSDYQSPEAQAAVIAQVLDEQSKRATARGVAADAAAGKFAVDPARDWQDYGTVLYDAWQPYLEKTAAEDMRLKKESATSTTTAWKSAASDVATAWKESASALMSIPGVGGASAVTDADMAMAQAGIYQPKADEKLRQLKDMVYNPEKAKDGSYGFSIADAFNAIGLGGLAGGTTEQRKAGYAAFEQAWNDHSLFADPANVGKWMNADAVEREKQKQIAGARGEQNIANAFGVGKGTDGDRVIAALEKIAFGKTSAASAANATATGKDIAGPQTVANPLQDAIGNLDAQLLAQTDKIKERGGTFWVTFETGLIDKAKASGALWAAVDTMVTAALAAKLPQ